MLRAMEKGGRNQRSVVYTFVRRGVLGDKHDVSSRLSELK